MTNEICADCMKKLKDSEINECEECGLIFCEECMGYHEEGRPVAWRDFELCPSCKSENITMGKKEKDWIYCNNCGSHYRPSTTGCEQ